MIAFFRKLGWLTQRRSKEEQLAAELQFHLEEETEERQAAGMSAREARGAARRELGNLGLVQEDTRATWSWTLLEQLVQDLRYGARTMLAQSRLHGIGVPVTGTGDWRQHGDLQPHGRIADAVAAGDRPGIARDTEVAHLGEERHGRHRGASRQRLLR